MNPLRWIIGDVEITQLVEMVDNKLFPTFIPRATPENILNIPWLRPHFVDENGGLNAQVQSFLIRSSGENILIDTCNGNGKSRPTVPTWGNLKTDFLNDLSPEDIDVIVCTHLHFDHVGWNTKRDDGAWVPTFPHAKYLFSKEEYDYWIKKPKKGRKRLFQVT